MDASRKEPTLETILSVWPITHTLVSHLPAGDLITLSRLSTSLRAILHGFPEAAASAESGTLSRSPSLSRSLPSSPTTSPPPRQSLYIGAHATPTWTTLKATAPFLCSDVSHTKGTPPRPCIYCSRPVCTACIVRSSLSRGHEKTFANRVRHLCDACWENGVPSKSARFPLRPPAAAAEASSAPTSSAKKTWFGTTDMCTCSLLANGNICTPCKDGQNYAALTHAATTCHGQGCGRSLQPDVPPHRICLWCELPLPRTPATPRYAWNAKLVEARARNAASRSADIEEWNRKRLASMRMSRREMRGDGAVRDLDAHEADAPLLVRHLDTINYRTYMDEGTAPSGADVYNSKRGYWRYSRNFLLKMERYCSKVASPASVEASFGGIDGANGAGQFARTNKQKKQELSTLTELAPMLPKNRLQAFNELKTRILAMHMEGQMTCEQISAAVKDEYGFEATPQRHRQLLDLWTRDMPLADAAAAGQGSQEAVDEPQPTDTQPCPCADQTHPAASAVSVRPPPPSSSCPTAISPSSSSSSSSSLPTPRPPPPPPLLPQSGNSTSTVPELPPPPTNNPPQELPNTTTQQQPQQQQRLSPAALPTILISRTSSIDGADTVELDLAGIPGSPPATAGHQTQEELLDLEIIAAVAALEANEARDEEPPPYTAEGWVWPS